MSAPEVLVVEDKASLRSALRKTLEAEGYSVSEAEDAYEARRALLSVAFLAVLTDLKLPAGSGFDVLDAVRGVDPDTPVIVMTAFGTVEDAVRAMKIGATDFLTKPVDTEHLLLLLQRSVARRRLLTEYVLLKEEYQRRFGLPRVLGESSELKEAMLALQRVAPSETTVLLLGESGTGKELMARGLHQLSPRASGPFVALNCAAIPEPLLENELFGHEKGAFTGATSRKQGKVELAHRGTLFLDEIGDLPAPLQPKILRLVQEREVERIGGLAPLKVDVRIVAATNQDLRQAVAEKLFREDLFFRLSVFPIEIPPLRRRQGDIPILAAAFVERFASELGRRGLRLSDAALEALRRHQWPGNVRELQNCLERAAILCQADVIEPRDLRLEAMGSEGPRLGDVLDLTGALAEVRKRALTRVEEECVRLALDRSGGDRRAAAERLGISPQALSRRLREAGPRD